MLAGADLGGIGAIPSWGSQSTASSILATRSGVGGTIGNPSLNFSRQNQSLAASQLSSTSMMGELKVFILSLRNAYGLSLLGASALFLSSPLARED